MTNVTILNTTIITSTGRFAVDVVSNDEAKRLVAEATTVASAIGHQATAEAASLLLGMEVPVNRVQYKQAQGDIALCLKLRGRLPEGVVLSSVEEMEEIGYDWWIITMM